MYYLVLIAIFIILFICNFALWHNIIILIWFFEGIRFMVRLFFLTKGQEADFGLSGSHALMPDEAYEFKVV